MWRHLAVLAISAVATIGLVCGDTQPAMIEVNSVLPSQEKGKKNLVNGQDNAEEADEPRTGKGGLRGISHRIRAAMENKMGNIQKHSLIGRVGRTMVNRVKTHTHKMVNEQIPIDKHDHIKKEFEDVAHKAHNLDEWLMNLLD